ncbi:hypothetical protein [Azospirillum melinis]
MEAELRGTLRALSVLQALNRCNGATITMLHRLTGIPRPSLYRVIDTLCTAGYVRTVSHQTYEVTFLVRSLSDGYRECEWIVEAARPVLHWLQRRVVWPTDLAVFSGGAMQLRDTTRPNSPLTFEPGTVGLRLPILGSALGRAYLAHCDNELCMAILNSLNENEIGQEPLDNAQTGILAMLQGTRDAGYGWSLSDTQPRMAGIAVPIFSGDSASAAIGITFAASAMTQAEAVQRYLEDLRTAAQRISQAFPLQEDSEVPQPRRHRRFAGPCLDRRL